ncbi:carbon storage regulator [Paenibacillus rhizosphaerae]|uniref:Translational regulator CsrA n=1 Tax=Paenibacillus rhizosphaerae TaxID=297318 RepID=A0A839TW17_9BACL|nr:carbon storage regulator CsrA [Paenibacillus rhizosphaerae]MBB3130892.1 carbon storage regulator [Paenibacillus rhizosphaerae]
MLVLSRKKGESIIIQDEIEITILAVEGDNVRLGITAPDHIDIFRKEIYLSIKEANLESATANPGELEGLLKHLKETKNY